MKFPKTPNVVVFSANEKQKQATNQAMSADFRIFDSSGPDGFKAWKDVMSVFSPPIANLKQ